MTRLLILAGLVLVAFMAAVALVPRHEKLPDWSRYEDDDGVTFA